MATRANRKYENVSFEVLTVETSQTVAVGDVVKDGNADNECQKTTDGVDAIGVVLAIGGNGAVTAGTAGDRVTVGMFGPTVAVKVGTGGAVRGKFAKVVSDGVTSATPDVATPAAANVIGIFRQSGSLGDLVGVMLCRSWLTE
jgi:hypothetical protein